ncbi:MAG: LPS export ABC transporter ATP-binding protein [Parvularcula sp.]
MDGSALESDLNGATLADDTDGLCAENLQKTFRRRQVVNHVSFQVRRGEAVGLLGPNGAGKTTCFYMVTGLIPADGGRILVDGYDVTRLPMYQRAKLGIGYLPQEASIFRGLTVEENIQAVVELVHSGRRTQQAVVTALLEEFGIDHVRHSAATALSGGERRRLEIARAVATGPDYMLLDEPFAGIDPLAIADIRELVSHLKNRGLGVLITDHNVRETLDIIDRAYIIHRGELLSEGTPSEIIENADVRRVYLGETFAL